MAYKKEKKKKRLKGAFRKVRRNAIYNDFPQTSAASRTGLYFCGKTTRKNITPALRAS
jgi:hypothetical protein